MASWDEVAYSNDTAEIGVLHDRKVCNPTV